jgi:hypothetical protein
LNVLGGRNGSVDDARERCYGFPPPVIGGPLTGLDRLAEAGVAFRMQEFSGEMAANDEARNRHASVQLRAQGDAAGAVGVGVWTEAAAAAVAEVAAAVRPLVAPCYRAFVARPQLVALQPNSHHSAAHLTLHLDQPMFEGFGVVVVTVALEGAATVRLPRRAVRLRTCLPVSGAALSTDCGGGRGWRGRSGSSMAVPP